MAALIVLVLTASFYSTVDGRSLSQATEEFQSLCSRRCGVEGASEAGDDSNEAPFPRFRCSCSPSCAVYEDCCHDSPHKNASMWQQFAFVCVSVVGRDRYRAVSSCPPSQRSDFCREALGHLPPVTSRTTNVTYGNVFCASCNGDRDDLATWNVELRCPSEDEEGEDELEDGGTRIAYSLGEFWKIDGARKSKRLCKFHAHFDDYSVVDGLELRSCDDGEAVSRCSASWTDMSVVEKCRSYEDPVYFDDTAYRNPHCALCNYLSLEFGNCAPFRVRNMLQMERADSSGGVLEFCRDRGAQACVRRLSELSKGRPYSLTHVLNVWVSECLPPDCCEGRQRYDFRTRRCRKIRRGP